MNIETTLREADRRALDRLIAAQEEGRALSRAFYTSDLVYDRDIAAYWNQSWLWAGHVSQIPEPGDFFRFDYGPESIIVARGRDGQVHAHLNVCRHRGSRVCTEQSGRARVFVCPYHAWTYELDGRLRAGRKMADGFDPEAHGLAPAHLRVFDGMILVSLAQTPPPIDEGLARLAPLVAPYGLADLRIAHTASYPVPANWKLAVENYMECYHCAPAHLDYARSHSLKDPATITHGMEARLAAEEEVAGVPPAALDLTGRAAAGPGADVYWSRYPLYKGYATGSRDGALLAPLLGRLKSPVGAATDLQIGPLNNWLVYSDHVVAYRFLPRGLQETEIQIVWMVRGDAEEGCDYDRDALTWLWHVTSLDDERIIRHNQEGVNSHRFEPGPLAGMEWAIRGFYDGYLAMIGAGGA